MHLQTVKYHGIQQVEFIDFTDQFLLISEHIIVALAHIVINLLRDQADFGKGFLYSFDEIPEFFDFRG